MPGSLSQADQHRHHYPNEPRLPQGEPHGRAWRRGRVRLISAPPPRAARGRPFAELVPSLCSGRALSAVEGLRMTIPLLLCFPSSIGAQASPWVRLGAHAIPVYILNDPVPGGRSLGEVRVTQPTLMAHAGAF